MITDFTANNLLYLYGLLTREHGIGTQTFLPRVEETLAADGIDPVAFGFSDTADLLSALDFVTLTSFKGGRVYATFARRADFDEALAVAGDQEDAKPAKKGGKPWKRKKAVLRPVKPQVRVKKASKAQTTEAKQEVEGGAKAGAGAQTTAEAKPLSESETAKRDGSDPKAKSGAAPESEPESTQVTERAEELGPASADVAEPSPVSTPVTEPASAAKTAGEEKDVPAAETSPVAEPEPAYEPAPEPDYTVARTLAEILAESRAQEAREAAEAARRSEEAAATEPADTEAESASAPESPTPHEPRRDYLPQDFWMEVHCPDELAAALSRVLPIDADLHTTVQEDWQVARSTGMLEATRSHAEFPLRYLREDGSPITISLNRRGRTRTGKRWEVVAVDGDTTGEQHEGADAAGAAVALEGAWARLSAVRLPAFRRVSPLRQVSETFAFSSWDTICADLASIARPEPWGTADEPYRVLREYLCVTFAAVLAQGKLATSDDGTFAAWYTGLFTKDFQPIYACLTPGSSATPWQLAGFSTAGADATCAHLTAADFSLPSPATYLTSLDDIRLAPEASVSVDESLASLASAIDAAVAHARADWRLAAPVWDPQDQMTKLLLPLAPSSESEELTGAQSKAQARTSTSSADVRSAAGAADASLSTEAATWHAVLLERSDDDAQGAYHAAAILNLADTYTCARIVSPTLPAWLSPAAAGLVLSADTERA